MDFAETAKVLQATGPYGFVMLFVYLYLDERKYTQQLHGKIVDMVTKGTEAAVTQTNAMSALKDVISKIG